MTATNNRIESLANYTLLGRSGLRVSPLCLGTMTFGLEWGWGSPKETAEQIFLRFIEAGGNFIDTANFYTAGTSEEMIGQFIQEHKLRDQIVVATKYSLNTRPGDPNACGNGRKNMMSAVDASLKRLKTDYIDLYWLHVWDGMTPVEEVMSTLNDLVRSGKVRYIGLSDTPAWYLSRAQTLAEWRGWEKVCSLQLSYSLAERNIEREHVPAALELGMGICPWSPLDGGFLTGKYTKDDPAFTSGRLKMLKEENSPFLRADERRWRILDVLLKVAKELNRSPAQVALNWITKRPGITSSIIGATKLTQLEDNLRALEFDIPQPLAAKLEEAGRSELLFPSDMFVSPIHERIMVQDVKVSAEPTWFR